ncbi:transposable element Tcb1 transposase [Trichonephila clavipes]|nr:transposable element Tcb1 transposase [Trichonephila clavipes]
MSERYANYALIALRGGVGTSGLERCHLYEDQTQDPLDRSVVEPSLGDPVSSRTIRRRLAEGHLGSRYPLRVLPLTPTPQRVRLKWCHARGNWTAAEWNKVMFSDESRFNLSSDHNRVRVWRPRSKHLNPAFALQQHTAPTAGVKLPNALREHALWTPQQWSCVRFSNESRFSLQCDSRWTLIWRVPGTRYHQENTIERHRYGGAGWLVWGGIILGSRTDLHVQSVTMTGHIYRDVILEQHVLLFRGAMGAEFLFMDLNARPHRANIVDECLQSEDITRMD